MLYPVSGPEAWKMIGRTIDTADVAGVPALTQRFRHPTHSVLLHGVQVGIILCNNPDFAAIEARIYADRGGAPGKLLKVSENSYTKAECLELEENAVKFAGFRFGLMNLHMGAWYHLALVPTAYTGDYGSHVGWRTSYPDPQYPTGLTLNAAKAAQHHLEFALVGALIGSES